MLFEPPRHDSILRRRLAGLSASAALHLFPLAIAALPASQPRIDQARREPAIVVTTIPPDVTAGDAASGDEPLEDRPALAVDGVTFDLAMLRARQDILFPFLTLDVGQLGVRRRPADDRRRRLQNPFAPAPAGPSRPPLALDDDALQSLVDRAWSRSQRWGPFATIAALLETHNPDTGRAAELLKAYTDQNLLQPYYDASTRDARYWTMLGLASDHATFIALVRRVSEEHGPSRVTTELLFLLEELAQGSRDTLLMVMATDPETDLRQTTAAHPEARSFAAGTRRTYDERLRARGIGSAAAIRVAYDEVRLRLLSTIVATSPGGYRAADARYLAGVILFEQNDLPGAERWWRGIGEEESRRCGDSCADVLRALRLPAGRRAAAIAAALGSAHRRWLDQSERRMRQFGYTTGIS